MGTPIARNFLRLYINKITHGAQSANTGSSHEFFNKFKQKVVSFSGTPMTREEALNIVDIKKDEFQADKYDEQEAKRIMERFDTLIEKN